MSTVEALIRKLWLTTVGVELPADPFPRMAYVDAMSRYGSDKPDIRLGMEVRWSMK